MGHPTARCQKESEIALIQPPFFANPISESLLAKKELPIVKLRFT